MRLTPFSYSLGLNGAVVIGLQLLQLALFTPLYDLDLNFFTKGIAHWDAQHPPLYGIFLLSLQKIYPSIYLPILLQIAFYGYASAVFAQTVTAPNSRKRTWLVLIAGIEPILTYYNLSTLSESLFVSFSLLWLSALINTWQSRRMEEALALGIWAACAFLTRYIGAIYLLAFIPLAFRLGSWRALTYSLTPSIIAFAFTYLGHSLMNGGAAINHLGILLWTNACNCYQPDERDNVDLRAIVAKRLKAPYAVNRSAERYAATLSITQDYQNLLVKRGVSSEESFVIAEKGLRKLAIRTYEANFYCVQSELISHNLALLWNGNFLDYRYCFPQSDATRADYIYLDDISKRLYNFALTPQHMNSFWLNRALINLAINFVIILAFITLIVALICWKRVRLPFRILVLAYCVIAFCLLFTFFPYKTRFFGIYDLWLFGALANLEMSHFSLCLSKRNTKN